MIHIKIEELIHLLTEKLLKHDVPEDIAAECARILSENSLDGVYSHGANRFPRLISYLQKGIVKPQNRPRLLSSFGALEQWDGQLGMGSTNARFCMDRAIGLARNNGIGCVALCNTNHWMRGGSYGIQAAQAGCVGICWTNTMPNMPAWGAKDRRIGNNPLVFAIPHEEGHVMVDGAMAQFSYGAIESAKFAGKTLSVPGGYDSQGELSCDPAEIEKTGRMLPIGYWKGSSFSILLDMVAAVMSNGNAACEVGGPGQDEAGLSQMFIAMDVSKVNPASDHIIQTILEDLKASDPVDGGQPIRYPSERQQSVRKENLVKGIPIEDRIWEQIAAL